jgi:predicted RNA-binding protein with PIN domain
MPTRTLYIDAYNVLRKQPRLSRLLRSHSDAARRGLVAQVTGSHPGVDVIVVFDGRGEPIDAGRRVRVVFTGGDSADAWIRRQIEKAANVKHTLVVSSDLEVARHARAMGAAVQSSEDFLARVSRGTQAESGVDRNRRLSEGEVREWMGLFSTKRENPGNDNAAE